VDSAYDGRASRREVGAGITGTAAEEIDEHKRTVRAPYGLHSRLDLAPQVVHVSRSAHSHRAQICLLANDHFGSPNQSLCKWPMRNDDNPNHPNLTRERRWRPIRSRQPSIPAAPRLPKDGIAA